MKWKNNQRYTGAINTKADWLADDDGTIVAEVRAPSSELSAFGYWHYNCRQSGCGDNLSSSDKARLKRVARKHQREVHREA